MPDIPPLGEKQITADGRFAYYELPGGYVAYLAPAGYREPWGGQQTNTYPATIIMLRTVFDAYHNQGNLGYASVMDPEAAEVMQFDLKENARIESDVKLAEPAGLSRFNYLHVRSTEVETVARNVARSILDLEATRDAEDTQKASAVVQKLFSKVNRNVADGSMAVADMEKAIGGLVADREIAVKATDGPGSEQPTAVVTKLFKMASRDLTDGAMTVPDMKLVVKRLLAKGELIYSPTPR